MRTRCLLPLLSCLALAACTPQQSTCPECPQPEPEPRHEAAFLETMGTVWPGIKDDGSVLLPSGWSLRPAGSQTALGDFPVDLVMHPERPFAAVLHAGYGPHAVSLVHAATGRVLAEVVVPESFAGLAFSHDGRKLAVGGGYDDVVHLFDVDTGRGGGQPSLKNHRVFEFPDRADFLEGPKRENPLQRVIGGVAFSADDDTLYVTTTVKAGLARFDVRSGDLEEEIELPADSFPLDILVAPSGRRGFVSLWNAKSVVELRLGGRTKITKTLPTGPHPNDMVLDGERLFVANANDNTVSVLDAKTGAALETLDSAIHPGAPNGSTPNALALHEGLLAVANANTNHVTIFDVSADESRSLGMVPTGWYPTGVGFSGGDEGVRLLVTNGKGASSRANRNGPVPGVRVAKPTEEYIARLLQGTLSTIELDPGALPEMTETVLQNTPIQANGKGVDNEGAPADSPIPTAVGGDSPIEHVVYIIKENRTYDQVLGDLPQGNGDPSLCLFPRRVTPNHHKLAEQFVLLDNFYVESEVSADGHEWTMGAYATDYVERTWPLLYRGNRRVPYPAEAAMALGRPEGGYLWDRAKAAGITYRSYGEFVVNGETLLEPATTREPALDGHFDPKFRSYDLSVTDVSRAERFLTELAEFEAKGEFPALTIIRLPNDHTAGTRPGMPTVEAYVADNDLALGQVVEGLSRSTFWEKMAIFVVEDDAQNGPDHVDAHRTIAFVVSPWTRNRGLDQSMYSTASMLRTMELILGLPPMSQFDAAARPMYETFLGTPDTTIFEAEPAQVDLEETNAPDAPLAAASQALPLDAEDQADDIAFNRIIWAAVRGLEQPMPAPVRAAFVFPEFEDEDEDSSRE